MRIGIFGGSFDPIHYGHLLLAEHCREQRQLDSVWFVPAAIPPHKLRQRRATAEQRVEMIELAIADHDAFHVCRIELDRGGVSYTVDTLSEVQRMKPGAELYLLMGSDTLAELPTWHRPADICRLANPVVVRRAGSSKPDFDVLRGIVPAEQLAQLSALTVQMPLVGLSSTIIRQRVAASQSIRYQTTPDVVQYIYEQRLYRLAGNAES
jgi:nicotinate-nucleotide adenylyltransferase